jgi:hypothetical protein
MVYGGTEFLFLDVQALNGSPNSQIEPEFTLLAFYALTVNYLTQVK